MIPFRGNVQNRQIHRDRKMSACQGVGEMDDGKQEVTLIGMRFLWGDDGNVLA